MAITKRSSTASLEFRVEWRSEAARHSERYFAKRVNFWRDIFPEGMTDILEGKKTGDVIHSTFSSEDLLRYDPIKKLKLDNSLFEKLRGNGHILHPRFGRFYPAGLLRGVRDIFSGNTQPFRCVAIESSGLEVDFNHPLADRNLSLEITVNDMRTKTREIGGHMNDWMHIVTNGPGMQARWQERPTNFFADDPFARTDASDDSLFYTRPRLVTHVDNQALHHITSIYGQYLRPGMDVLDLMSSWRSDVPESLQLGSLVGLGLNEEELQNNPQLSSYVVHDLNERPTLPFEDQSFDAIICTVSVEYMVRPFEVFSECARILKPNGTLIHTFSNRWFPPKVIGIWKVLNEYERMGLVLEYFLRSEAFENIETTSMRGWPRPDTDQHYPKLKVSDPVFAVAGKRK